MRKAELETEVLRLRAELAEAREEARRLHEVNRMNSEALKEHSRLFRQLKPARLPISADRKLYVAGEQLYKCGAPHGRERCPRWRLCDGSFGPEGFEVHHAEDWAVAYAHAGQLVALCHACHALTHRLARMKDDE